MRAAMTLLVMVLTTATAWAQTYTEDDVVITLNQDSWVYIGDEICPTVTGVSIGGERYDISVLISDGMKVSYSSNTDASSENNTPRVRVTLPDCNVIPEDLRGVTFNKSFTITKAPLTVTAGSTSKVYDGTPLTCNDYTVEGLVGYDAGYGVLHSATVTGSQTDVGTSANVPSNFTVGHEREANYDINYVNGTLTVSKGTPTVTAPTPVEGLYARGTPMELVTAGSANFGTLKYSLDGSTYSEDIPTASDAGTYTVYYKVDGSDNWNAVEPQTVVAIINTSTNISTCTAIVPNQLQNGTFYIGYNFEYDGHGGIKVYDGETLLTYGTDYYYTTTESLDTDKYKDDFCTHVGEHCRVHLEGTGAYVGELTGDFIILSVSGSGTWGNNLAWSYADGTLSITGDGAMAESKNSDYSKYPWYDYCFNITTISIGEGITSVAANAFGGTNNENPYGGATTVSLPSTLNSIGEGAFAYCTGLTFNVDDLMAKGVTIGLGAFNKVGCIVGSLQDMGDNTEMIEIMNPAISADVTLNGRTLYKDGKWNTICLPFDVDLTDDECPLKAAGVEARTVAVASITGETLNLTFSNPVTTLEAGVPYIIKWENDTENPTIVNPVFNGVTVDAEPHNYDSKYETVLNYATDARVRFLGTYDAMSFSAADSNILMMGGNNTLYYPGDGAGLGACRAYFKIGEDSGSQAKIRSFNLNFDEGTESGIIDLKAPVMDERNATDGWYTLSGVRLNGKPTEKGMYIYGGKKVMVK